MIEQVITADGALRSFNDAGVLAPIDVHAARTMARICGEDDPQVLLAAALAVRAPRFGHVCVDLRHVQSTVTVDDDVAVAVADLPWPSDVGEWVAALAASPLVGTDCPLRLDGERLYLERYWLAEQQVLAWLQGAAANTVDVDEAALAADLDRLFSTDTADLQRRAAETAVRRRLAVIAGGPGTGKTYTISRIIELLEAQAAALGHARPKIALAAPTGKAAARVTESIGGGHEATTIHRLLRRHPGNATRFRHDGSNPLPHDVVILDETSMVSLTLMAKLLDAVRPGARVVLVGDPDQLVSVEAGAVLGDIVGPGPTGSITGVLRDSIVTLERERRYGEASGIAELAHAIKSGEPAAVLDTLRSGRDDLDWLEVDVADDSTTDVRLLRVREAIVAGGRAMFDAACSGDGAAALAALNGLRVLCAHRRGPYGVATWIPRIERWLAASLEQFAAAEQWYLGRPVIVTQNDYQLGVSNGDVGVTIAKDDRRVVAFATGDTVRTVSPSRLDAVDTVHAMTIHKSQGSQFDHAVVVLPEAASPILTRELLYTAATRAQSRLTLVGTEAAVSAAVARRVHRTSGLRERLWP
jgi:exodeoxyribonuclease V alpha subunit